MKNFLYVVLVLFMSIVCGQLHAATISLIGVTTGACPYNIAYTDAYGNVTVMCEPNWTGVGIARIEKGYGNSCNYWKITTRNNGYIQASCQPPIVSNTPAPDVPHASRTKDDGKNLSVCVDKNGMYAWTNC